MRGVWQRCAVACLAWVISLPVSAQSFDEAVRTNSWIAIDLCMTVMLDRVPPRAVFEPAGFTPRSEYRGVNSYGIDLGFNHYFDTPGDTVRAQVPDLDQMAGSCSIYSTHLVQAELEEIARAAVFHRFPASQVGSEGALMVRRSPSDLPLIISAQTITNTHRYEAPGTVWLSMSFPG